MRVSAMLGTFIIIIRLINRYCRSLWHIFAITQGLNSWNDIIHVFRFVVQHLPLSISYGELSQIKTEPQSIDGWMCLVCACSDHGWCQIKSIEILPFLYICVCGRPTTTKLLETFYHRVHISWFPVGGQFIFYSNVMNDAYTLYIYVDIEYKIKGPSLSSISNHHQLNVSQHQKPSKTQIRLALDGVVNEMKQRYVSYSIIPYPYNSSS